ncbi:uncharacterized protein Z518_10518 [Rhinocladiella mackenziei CBS 650.93]|uniref:Uncharacterized protein n=1 Tax=Rhinocladiella mackenziei CBS 650.93 TaxID=1442369 RepID=A0A0D2I3M1_9EURO|nr:uncharacterized protein Z518_10518 [Rhinocladiella mackenziei CBS 650.93]KIX00379.1 hypothetical protein Z518_10518 [Rhinocladiella mackenziei CBS 650.93]
MQKVAEDTELTEQQPPTSTETPKSEFDPCCNAKITSPFYLYNHDSSRPSFDVKKPDPVQVAIHDVEAGTANLSPSITQEKRDAQNAVAHRFKFWKREKQCMTKPKPRGCMWLKQLPPRQRLIVKLLMALVIIGAMVGIAVGITASVHGGVYKSNNSTTPIG